MYQDAEQQNFFEQFCFTICYTFDDDLKFVQITDAISADKNSLFYSPNGSEDRYLHLLTGTVNLGRVRIVE